MKAIGIVVVLAIWVSAAAAQAPGGTPALHPDAEAAWTLARTGVQHAQDALKAHNADAQGKHVAAEQADDELLTVRDPARLAALAGVALQRRAQFLQARDRAEQAARDLETARALLRTVASDITRCASPDGEACQARRFWASRAKGPATQAAPDYDWLEIARIAEKGLGALTLAKEIRGRIPKGFESGDGALAYAAKAASATGAAEEARRRAAAEPSPAAAAAATSAAASDKVLRPNQKDDEFEPIRNARDAYEGAFEIYRHAQSVLDPANAVARHALALADCLRDRPAPCPAADGHQLKLARERLAALDALDASTKASLEKVTHASEFAEIGASYPKLGDRQRVALIRRTLAGNKDAAALFGGPGFRLAANKNDTVATLRIDLDRQVNDPFKDTALTFSSKVAGDRTTLYGVSEGTGGAFNATLSKTLFRPVLDGNNAVLPDVVALGFSLSLGYDEYTFRDPENLADETGTRVRRVPWSLGFKLASVSDGARRWHSYGVNLGRAYKAAGDSTRCPPVPAGGSASLACTVAAFGPPSQTPQRLFTYENRFSDKGRVPVALIVKYEDVKGTKEVDLPIYLFKGGEKNDALTGGIQLSWRSGERGSAKPSQTSLGVFVGGPFSVFGSASP